MGLTADSFRTTRTWKGNGAGRLSHETKYTPLQYILLVSLLALVYVGLAKLGHSFTVPGSDTAFIWPPAGYATAVLYLFGLRFIPAVSLGCYLAGVILYQLSPSALLMLTGISTFEPIIAVLLLRWMNFDPSMGRVRDGVALIVSAGIISSMCAATLGTILFSADGQLDFSLFWQNWLVFWIANSSANMSLTPLLLTWASPAGVLSLKLKTKTFAKLELGLQVAVAIGVSSLALKGEKQFSLELEYMLFPVLTWAGLRFGPRASSTVIVAATAVSLLLTTRSLAGSSEQSIYAQLLSIQMFLTVFAITGHLLGGAAEERARTQSQLSQARAETISR